MTTRRYSYEEVIKTREQLTAHAKLNRAVRVPYLGLKKAIVGALIVTTHPHLAKVHPAYAGGGSFAKSETICSIPFSWSSGYDKDTDTFATLCSADAVKVILQDQVLGCLRCKNTTEYEGEYGAESCMGCLVEGPFYSDGKGNPLPLKEGDTVVWYEDGTFAVQ